MKNNLPFVLLRIIILVFIVYPTRYPEAKVKLKPDNFTLEAKSKIETISYYDDKDLAIKKLNDLVAPKIEKAEKEKKLQDLAILNEVKTLKKEVRELQKQEIKEIDSAYVMMPRYEIKAKGLSKLAKFDVDTIYSKTKVKIIK